MAGNKHHQDAVPPERFKFDKAVDAAARAETDAGPLYTMHGEMVKPTAGAQKERYRVRREAQMKSHKNPKNRG